MFQALCAHHQEVKIALHSLWYHHTYSWPSRAQNNMVYYLLFVSKNEHTYIKINLL